MVLEHCNRHACHIMTEALTEKISRLQADNLELRSGLRAARGLIEQMMSAGDWCASEKTLDRIREVLGEVENDSIN